MVSFFFSPWDSAAHSGWELLYSVKPFWKLVGKVTGDAKAGQVDNEDWLRDLDAVCLGILKSRIAPFLFFFAPFYLCACIYTCHMCRGVQRARRFVGSLGAGVIDNCESSNMGPGNQTQVLFKSCFMCFSGESFFFFFSSLNIFNPGHFVLCFPPPFLVAVINVILLLWVLNRVLLCCWFYILQFWCILGFLFFIFGGVGAACV